ncbi:fasciclin-like arabinogalactan protein 14 [Aristolochia californica]|uniref:fasciclin-like arabinogalactan protein 14 n=1 Tax=Aristolochia californica TaxID=171875 RepID=UPI0035DD8EA0
MAITWFLFFAIFLLSPSAYAFNITAILDRNPDFSTFNSLLTQTGVAAEINARRTITVLALDNGAAGSFSGRPDDLLKFLVSLHVVLDYYDLEKLHKMTKKSTLLTTLFQTSGMATNQQGHLNLTHVQSGEFRIGSAVPGSSLVSNVVKEVASLPYNISVLQVSSIIVPTGIENINSSVTPPPAPSPKAATPSSAPAPSDSKKNKTTPAPAPDDDSVAPAPSDDGAPSEAPTSGPGPSAELAPAGEDADAPSPSTDDDDDSSNSSLASRHVVSYVGAVVGLICMAAAW